MERVIRRECTFVKANGRGDGSGAVERDNISNVNTEYLIKEMRKLTDVK